MKIVRIFLAVVVMFSLVYPCMDGESISLVEEIVINTSEDFYAESEDNCSPFCICACCSIAFPIELQNSTNTSVPSTNSVIQLQDNYLFNPLLSIWQPPKV